jgi:putative Ca2+/H+ antiporter (TMEM165/GDT1 family)
MFSLPTILSTFGMVFIAELPDKTALAVLLLASRYRARSVILGAWLAFLVQTLVAVIAGRLLGFLPPQLVRVASGIGFLIFALMSFRKDAEDEEGEERQAVAARAATRPIWLISFLVIFAAEWGDLTQLATAALVARGQPYLSVGMGAVLALWCVTLLAVYSGRKLRLFIKPRLLNILGGIMFAAIGIYMIASSFAGR